MHLIITIFLKVLLILLVLLAGIAASVATMFGLARWINHLSILLTSGALVLMLWVGAGVWLLTRQLVWSGVVPCMALLVVAGLVPWLFPPLNFHNQDPEPLPEMRFWQLSTGSQIAYTLIPAVEPAKPDPIVFLHGGPGWVILESDVQFYSQLALDGYNVYLFDQVGSGRSSRLEVQEYQTNRYVADLEAIRESIGAEKMILIGQSWGNTLAVDYMAAYPDRVSAVIFSSPGAMWDVSRFKPDYSNTAQVGEATSAFPPLRVITSLLMIPRNPRLAEQIASDSQVEGFFNTLPSTSLLGQNYCAGAESKVPKVKILGTNQFVNRLVFASQKTYPDPRPALRLNHTPALILRGDCEFLPEALALEYRDTLPNATLIEISNAGHALYGAQPERVLAAMRTFLSLENTSTMEYSELGEK